MVTRLVAHGVAIDRLTAEAISLAKELRTQLTRIGQIQAELDHMASGRNSKLRNRLTFARTKVSDES